MARVDGELSFECGALIWSRVRDLVKEAKWRGYSVDLFEGSGWISRRFIIRGERGALEPIQRTLIEWNRTTAPSNAAPKKD